MSADQALTDYRALLEKVSAKFSEIFQNNQSRMQCAKGCSSCCLPDLTVSPIERENIRLFLESNSALKKRLSELEALDPHQGNRCRFLDEKGNCAVYEVRPVICRSHGAPIFSKISGSIRDVCPLNFTDVTDLSALDSMNFINLDLLNQILALLNQRFAPQDPLQRTPLTLGEISSKTK